VTRYLLAVAAAAAALAVPAAPASADGCMPDVVRCATEALCLQCVPDPPLSVYICLPPPLHDLVDLCIWFPPWPPSGRPGAMS
jgi:hypothetical protein